MECNDGLHSPGVDWDAHYRQVIFSLGAWTEDVRGESESARVQAVYAAMLEEAKWIEEDHPPALETIFSFPGQLRDWNQRIEQFNLKKAREFTQSPGELDLRGRGLTRLPVELIDKEVSVIRLENNHLSRLPRELFQLKKLHTLGLMGNPLAKLPKELGRMGTIQALSVSSSLLQQVINNFDLFASLKKLELDSTDGIGFQGIECTGKFEGAAFQAFQVMTIGEKLIQDFDEKAVAEVLAAPQKEPSFDYLQLCRTLLEKLDWARDYLRMTGYGGKSPQEMVAAIAQRLKEESREYEGPPFQTVSDFIIWDEAVRKQNLDNVCRHLGFDPGNPDERVERLDVPEVWDLRGCHLTRFPEELCRFRQVTKIFLFNDQMVGLPAAFKRFRNLRIPGVSNRLLTILIERQPIRLIRLDELWLTDFNHHSLSSNLYQSPYFRKQSNGLYCLDGELLAIYKSDQFYDDRDLNEVLVQFEKEREAREEGSPLILVKRKPEAAKSSEKRKRKRANN